MCKMWDVSRLEIKEMFSNSCRYKSAEGEVSVNMGMNVLLFLTLACNHWQFSLAVEIWNFLFIYIHS